MAEIEESVFTSDRPRGYDPSQRIFKLKREVLALYRNTEPLLDPLTRLAAGELPGAHPELATYFRDVEDHLTRVVTAVAHLRDLLTASLDANLAQVTVRDRKSTRLNSSHTRASRIPP